MMQTLQLHLRNWNPWLWGPTASAPGWWSSWASAPWQECRDIFSATRRSQLWIGYYNCFVSTPLCLDLYYCSGSVQEWFCQRTESWNKWVFFEMDEKYCCLSQDRNINIIAFRYSKRISIKYWKNKIYLLLLRLAMAFVQVYDLYKYLIQSM